MLHRSRLKLFCVAICVASALLCALNRAPVLAVVQTIAAMAVWRVRFGRALESNDVGALIARLRDARNAEEGNLAMIRATVTPNVMAVPTPSSQASRWSQIAMAFRDEMTADRWRQLTTALRHQPRPVVPAALATKNRRI